MLLAGWELDIVRRPATVRAAGVGRIEMRFLVIVAAALGLSGCAGMVKDDTEKTLAQSYIACNRSTSAIFARQPGDVISLGIAAESQCAKDRYALSEHLQSKYSPQWAAGLATDLQKDMIRENSGTIAKERAIKSNALPD